MAQIAVDQVQAGMVLAAEVTDKRGRLLIPSGRTLDPKHVQALRMWGISRVEIEGDEPSGEAASDLTPESLEKAREVLTDRLRNLEEGDGLREVLLETLVPRVARDFVREVNGV